MLLKRCLIFNALEYTRCGNESAQCIRMVDRCNGLQDCVNAWDEDISTCYHEEHQQLFASSRNLTIVVIFCYIRYML